MKVTKDFDDKMLSVYTPDEDEKELLYKVSDEVIDLIDKYNLNDDQRIHLISSLYESMKEMYEIEGMKHFESDNPDNADKQSKVNK